MAFKVVKTQTVKWPVTMEIAVDGGRFQKETFEAEFKRLPQSRIKEISKLIEEGGIMDAELCKEVVVGWNRVLDDNNQEIPFSDSALEQFLDITGVAKAIVFAFLETVTGARRKN